MNLGATTIWERWNSVLPDGKISDTGMNSLNHYTYGAIMEWVYRDVAGSNPLEDAPGFRKALIEPKPDYSLPKVRVRYNSAMGWYESAWEIQKNLFVWDVEVPFGAQAILVFPNGDMDALAKAHPALAFERCEQGKVCAVASAGKYRFAYTPTEVMHRVVSLDLPVTELMAIPEAREIVFEELPMTRGFGGGGPGMDGSQSARTALTGNFLFTVPAEKIKAIEERFAALN